MRPVRLSVLRPSAVEKVGRLFGIDTTTPLGEAAGCAALISATAALVTAVLR
jgi:hypothetical protein